MGVNIEHAKYTYVRHACYQKLKKIINLIHTLVFKGCNFRFDISAFNFLVHFKNEISCKNFFFDFWKFGLFFHLTFEISWKISRNLMRGEERSRLEEKLLIGMNNFSTASIFFDVIFHIFSNFSTFFEFWTILIIFQYFFEFQHFPNFSTFFSI